MPLEHPPATINAPSQSFSGLITQTPMRVVTVSNASESQACIKTAIAEGLTVNFRGAGHSFGDHCISDNGVLILNADKSRFDLKEDGTVFVSGGYSWSDLERKLNARGRRCPVLTNWPDVTVAGTMAFGGFGCSSYKWGSQVDNVTAFEIIDSAGDLSELRPENSEGWSLAACTSGRFGFITAVELRTQPFASHLAQYVLSSTSIDAFKDDLVAVSEAAEDSFEMMMGQISTDGFKVVIGQPCEKDARPTPDNLGGVLAQRAWRDASTDYSEWLHDMQERNFRERTAYLWADYVVSEEHLPELLRLSYDMAFAHDGAEAWRPRVRVLSMRANSEKPSPHLLSTTRTASSGTLFGVGVYLEPHIEDIEAVEHCRETLRQLLRLCLDAGGRPYLSGWHEPDHDVMRGDDWEAARQLLAKRPNDALINPGQMPLI